MDAGEVIKLLIVLAIVIAPAIGQIVAKLREAQKPPANPLGKPRVPRPTEETFKNEIEDFLRRAAEGRTNRGQGRPSSSVQRPKSSAAAQPAAQPASSPEGPQQSATTVVEHVQKHLDTSDFGRRTQQLGGEVALADDKADAHLHEVFEHQLSQFDWRTPQEQAAAGVTPMAAGVAGVLPLLADPQNLRQAIVLTEILQRPESRWH